MRAAALVFAVLPLALACGEVPSTIDAGVGDDGNLGPDASTDPCDATSLTVDQFFTCISQTVCDLVSDCFGSSVEQIDCNNVPINLFDNLSTAAGRRVLESDITRGRVTWNPTAAAACIAGLRTGKCTLLKDNRDLLTQCRAIVGTVANGGACQAEFECSTVGAQCQSTTGGATCGSQSCQPPVAAGQACTNGAFCGPDDHCVSHRGGGGLNLSVCQTGAAGASCDGPGDCDPGFFCMGGANDGTAAGTCAASKPAGSNCRSDDACQGELMCVGDTMANPGTCVDVRAAGAQCDAILGCFGHQYCAGAANVVGTCTPALALGNTCGTSQGIGWCGATLACDGTTCAGAGAVGATCTRGNDGVFADDPNGCNSGLHCTTELTGAATGICEAPLADNRPCTQDDQCTHGYCDAVAQVCQQIPVCN